MNAFLTQSIVFLPIPVPAFGAYIRQRRIELGLNRARAATMAGIDRSEWSAIEDGWVPTRDERLLRSIAGTLQFRFDAMINAIAPLEAHFEDISA